MSIPVEVEAALKAIATEAAEKAVSSRQSSTPAPVVNQGHSNVNSTKLSPAERLGIRFQKAYVDEVGGRDSRLTRSEIAEITQKAGLLGGTATSGAELVPVPVGDEIIIPLREDSVLMKAGAKMFTYNNSLQLGKMTAGVTLAWGAEAAAPSASSATSAALTLGAYQVAGYLQISNQALKSSPDVSAAVAKDVQNALVAEFDAKAFVGTGANSQPTGLMSLIHADNTNNATGSATNATIRADLAAAVKLVRNNVNENTIKSGFWAMSPTIFYSLLGKSDTNGGVAFPTLHAPQPTLLGFPVYVTSALSTSVFFGCASTILTGVAVNEVGAGLQGTDLVQGTTTVYGRLGMDVKLAFDKSAASIDGCVAAGW